MEEALSHNIGIELRKAREAQDLTQQDAAEMIGVSVEFYSRIERGKGLPSLENFVRIAVALRVSTDRLVGIATPEGVKSAIEQYLPPAPVDTPEFKRQVRRLREASPKTRRVADLVVREMENASEEANGAEPKAKKSTRRKRSKRTRAAASPPATKKSGDDDDGSGS